MRLRAKGYKKALWIVVLVAILIAAANFLGTGTMCSAVRIGYRGSEGWRSWSAGYLMLNGKLKHTIRLKDTREIIHVDVVTESGNISIEMEDTDGHVLFEKENIVTSSFEVKASGKVTVRVKADKHKGSFRIEAVE